MFRFNNFDTLIKRSRIPHFDIFTYLHGVGAKLKIKALKKSEIQVPILKSDSCLHLIPMNQIILCET